MVEVPGNEHAEVEVDQERRQSPDIVASATIRVSVSPTKADSVPSTDVTIQGDTSPTIEQFGVEQRTSGTENNIHAPSKESLEIEMEAPPQPTKQEAKKQKRAQKAALEGLSEDGGCRLGNMILKRSTAESDIPEPQTVKVSTHKRFNSEEPNASDSVRAEPLSRSKARPPAAIVEDDTSDSDSAPEAITKSTSTDLAQSTANSVSKAIAQKAAADKLKRRKRNEAFKVQAQNSTKRTAKTKRSTSSPEALAPSQKRLTLGDPLPDLLPDYILQATPGERLVTPPPEKVAVPKSNKLRFLDRGEKRPKDVRKGDVTVRVLEGKGRLNLPPRASKSSRDLRESWLSGMRKGVQMERRSWKKGFVRR